MREILLLGVVALAAGLWSRQMRFDTTDLSPAVHTIPSNDLIEHDTTGAPCVCGPDVIASYFDDGSVAYHVIHASLDGREHHEPDHDREACPLCQCDLV